MNLIVLELCPTGILLPCLSTLWRLAITEDLDFGLTTYCSGELDGESGCVL